MTEAIFTDYVEATRINNWAALRNMGRKANLPIYETIVSILEKSPGILIQHVKAHGHIQKQPHWTRAQWGNHYVDRLVKGLQDEWAGKYDSALRLDHFNSYQRHKVLGTSDSLFLLHTKS